MHHQGLPKQQNRLVFSAILAVSFFSMAFARSYLRSQTTIVGYELGELKKNEEDFLEQRAQLQMELAKLTTKDHLMLLSKNSKNVISIGTVAVHR